MFEHCRNDIDAIATAALAGPFAIYEFGNSNVLPDCVARGYFNRLKPDVDFVLISDNPQLIGQALQTNNIIIGAVHDFNHLRSANVTSVVILDNGDPHRLFERVNSLAKFSPNNVYTRDEAWLDRTYRQDNILQKALEKTGPMGSEGLSSKELLTHIIDCLIEIKRRRIPGDIVNLGVYKGWSVQFLAEICGQIGLTDRMIYAFDTFGGFIPGGGDDQYDTFIHYMKNRWNEAKPHSDTSLEFVANRLSSYKNIALVKGDICETIKEISGKPVCFALFDMDNYTPTKVALRPVYDVLSPNGFIVHDHFSLQSCGSPGIYGQRKAMLEFLAETPMFNLTGTNVFSKSQAVARAA